MNQSYFKYILRSHATRKVIGNQGKEEILTLIGFPLNETILIKQFQERKRKRIAIAKLRGKNMKLFVRRYFRFSPNIWYSC